MRIREYDIPDGYRPISTWGYLGYNILFSIPILGFLFAIIIILGASNINLKNWSKSINLAHVILYAVMIALYIAAGF